MRGRRLWLAADPPQAVPSPGWRNTSPRHDERHLVPFRLAPWNE